MLEEGGTVGFACSIIRQALCHCYYSCASYSELDGGENRHGRSIGDPCVVSGQSNNIMP